jgi:ubiquinone/menaquinone biosynthesis C-methylase UbiE
LSQISAAQAIVYSGFNERKSTVSIICSPLSAQDNPLKYEFGDRDGRQNPEYVIQAIGLTANMSIADVGAGGGYFTVRFASVVGPEGKVIATDIKESYLDFIRERVANAGHSNVEYILAGEQDPRLPDRSVDIAFLSSVYHHLQEPLIYLQRLGPALKDGGRLVIVENFRRITSHGSRVKDVVAIAERAGFKLVKVDESQDRFFIAAFSFAGE